MKIQIYIFVFVKRNVSKVGKKLEIFCMRSIIKFKILSF